jgi:Tfp pilus assembly protein PilO
MRDWPWYGYVVVALIIFGLFFILYYRPKDNELKQIRADRETTEREVARLKQKEKELEQIEKEIESMNAQLRDLETIIPQKEEIDVILRRIQQLAYDSRINITKFIPKNLIEKELISEKPISIDLTGNYHNLALFFNRLGNFARLFNIENFSIKSMRTQSDAATITATATAKTYIFREPAPPPETKTKKKGRAQR